MNRRGICEACRLQHPFQTLKVSVLDSGKKPSGSERARDRARTLFSPLTISTAGPPARKPLSQFPLRRILDHSSHIPGRGIRASRRSPPRWRMTSSRRDTSDKIHGRMPAEGISRPSPTLDRPRNCKTLARRRPTELSRHKMQIFFLCVEV